MLTGGQTPCEAMNQMRAAPNAIAHGAALLKEASETGCKLQWSEQRSLGEA
ncbi:MAG: hypothetical protein IJR26_05265 [Bacteroidales bacterium]|nr:hypothetical protein [Bacteroidales bacterium]